MELSVRRDGGDYPLHPTQSVKNHNAISVDREVIETVAITSMTAKAASVFGVKAAMQSGLVAMTVGLKAIGGMLVAVQVPLAVYNTYKFVQMLRKVKGHVQEKVMHGVKAAANYILVGAGATLLAVKTGVAGKAALSIAMILGPVGVGIMSLLSLVKGGKTLLEAKKATDPNVRRTKILEGVKQLLFGIGLGMGAATLTGLLATPIGWAAVGVVAAGLVLHIGAAIYQHGKAKSA